jgi:uncharacterized protein (TIGR03083 family)
MGELGNAYAGVRERVNDLVRGADATAWHTVVPATPAWTVHDLVAHVTGVAADITEGRLDGVATDPWTARQVESRRHHDTLDVLDEWNRCAPAIEGSMDGYGPAAFTLLADTVTHEHDVRGALGEPGARDSDAIALWWNACAQSGAASSGPALEFEVETGTVIFGTGPPVATLRATRFEVLRAITGRRSIDQMRAFVQRGDFDVAVLVGDPFTVRTDPLVE